MVRHIKVEVTLERHCYRELPLNESIVRQYKENTSSRANEDNTKGHFECHSERGKDITTKVLRIDISGENVDILSRQRKYQSRIYEYKTIRLYSAMMT